MTKLFAVGVVLGWFATTSGAHASDFQILKDFYDASTAPAALTDIDPYVPVQGTQTQTCVFAVENANFPGAAQMSLARFSDVLIHGIPPLGPLLPGIPDRRMEECVVWAFSGPGFQFPPGQPPRDLSSTCANQTVTVSGSDLIVAHGAYLAYRPDQQISFRKNGNMVAFKGEDTRTDPTTGQPTLAVIAYGYCYGNSR